MGKRIAVTLLVVLVVIGVRVGYTQLRNNDAVAPEASKGECLHVISASATDTETEKVDCSDPTGLYEVASTSDGTATCPTEDYLTYTKTAGSAKSTLCLVANLAEGTCYGGLTGLYSVAVEADCSSPDADAKVGLRADGQNDPSLCDQFGPVLGAAIAYPDPARTYCLVAPDA
ncbi:hypothetical protein GCM10027047_02760 [Rhodococcus aerolatus]